MKDAERSSRRKWMCVAAAAWWGGGVRAQPGPRTAPDFDLPTQGGRLRLSEMRGRPVYLDFWASWCAPCLESFPWMRAQQTRWAAQGLQIIAINVDRKREDALRFLGRVPVNFAVCFDAQGTTPEAYEVKAMPSSYFIDAQGRVAWEHRGFDRASPALLEARLEQALGRS